MCDPGLFRSRKGSFKEAKVFCFGKLVVLMHSYVSLRAARKAICGKSNSFSFITVYKNKEEAENENASWTRDG
jgi:hypothetical protein